MALADVIDIDPRTSGLSAHLENAALAALAKPALAALAAGLRLAEVAPRTTLWDGTGERNRVIFPLSGVMAIAVPVQERCDGIEVATIGRETCAMARPGTCGVALTFMRLFHVSAPLFANVVRQDEDARRIATASTDWLLLQARQLAACNAAHPVHERLSRWLLAMSDRLGGIIPATQETISELLGTRRTTITTIAPLLVDKGIIRYRRGNIQILKRHALEAAACGCYAALAPANWPFGRPGKCEASAGIQAAE